MDIGSAIASLGVTISNWFGVLIRTVSNFFSGLWDVIQFIVKVIETLVYGVTSLVSGVFRLLDSVFEGGVFESVGRAFGELTTYIGVPATILMASLLLLAVARIGIAFIFKLLKMDIGYALKRRESSKDDLREHGY